MTIHVCVCVFLSSRPGHFHIFVGDLSAEVDTDMLRTAFQPYGTIS